MTLAEILAEHRRTRDDRAMLRALVEHWRTNRAPRLANAIERLGRTTPDDFRDATKATTRALSKVTVRRAGAAMKKALAKIDDDPRLTVVLVGWLQSAKWPGSGAADLWDVVLGRLVDLRDARAIAPLERATKDVPPFLGVGHTKEMIDRVARTAKRLEDACAGKPPSVDEASLAEIEKLLREPAADFFARKRAVGEDALELVKRVWENPDDDDLRRVTADALLEAGNAWGEFITLQFHAAEGNADAAKKADALLAKHARDFCGPVAKIVKQRSRVFEKGFLVACATDATMIGRRDWEAAASAPHWGTVKRVRIDMSSTPLWWISVWAKNPALKNVRRVEIAQYSATKVLLERDVGAPFAVTKIGSSVEHYVKAFKAFVSALPPDARKAVTLGDIPRAASVRAALAEAQRA